MLEDDYPYRGYFGGSCKYDEDKGVGTVSSWHKVASRSQADLQGALMQGPVSVAVRSSSINFQLYRSGIITSAKRGTKTDHDVLAVGYGTVNGQDYYLVKNSWGKLWGEHGFVRIGAEEHGDGICGI